jgi:hypothetical protein
MLERLVERDLQEWEWDLLREKKAANFSLLLFAYTKQEIECPRL